MTPDALVIVRTWLAYPIANALGGLHLWKAFTILPAGPGNWNNVLGYLNEPSTSLITHTLDLIPNNVNVK